MERKDYDVQGEMTRWMYGVGFTRDDFLSQAVKLGEEYQEFLKAWLEGDEDGHVAEELTDVALVAIGCLSLMGVDFDAEAEKKMGITWQKYDPVHVQALMDQGLTQQEALHILKHRWNRSHGLEHTLPPSPDNV